MTVRAVVGIGLLAAIAGCNARPAEPPYAPPTAPAPQPPTPERIEWLRGQVIRWKPGSEAEVLALGADLDPLMAAFLADPHTDRRRLMRGLEFFQVLPSRPALRELAVAHLAHEDKGVRRAAALAVRSVAAEPDLVALLPLLDSSQTWVASDVVDALARHGGPQTRTALDAWLRAAEQRGLVLSVDQLREVRDARDNLTRRFQPPLVPAAPTTDAEWLHAAFARTADDDPAVRVAALRVLADLGGADDLGSAVGLLDDVDAKVYEAAVAAVVKAGGDRALVALDVWLRVAADWGIVNSERVVRIRKGRDELAERLKKPAAGK